MIYIWFLGFRKMTQLSVKTILEKNSELPLVETVEMAWKRPSWVVLIATNRQMSREQFQPNSASLF